MGAREITKIVVHCSDSPRGRGDDAATIHRWHRERKWSGVGYHWIIGDDGKLEAGRPWYWQGSHVRGHNHDSIGICLIGVDEFSGEQIHTLRELVDVLRKQWPDANVLGHCDLDPGKTCPNFDVRELLGE